MTLRIVVDWDLCQGHGVCETEAPEVFAVQKNGELLVVQETVGEGMRQKVEAAARYCPTLALRIVED